MASMTIKKLVEFKKSKLTIYRGEAICSNILLGRGRKKYLRYHGIELRKGTLSV